MEKQVLLNKIVNASDILLALFIFLLYSIFITVTPAEYTAELTGSRTDLGDLTFLSGNWQTGDDGLRGNGSGDIFAMSSIDHKDFIYEAKIKRNGYASINKRYSYNMPYN